MNIPLLDLKRQYSDHNYHFRQSIDTAIKEVFNSGSFILGIHVKQFEEECSNYFSKEDKVYCLGVSSGTDALLIALMAIDIQPYDEVILPAYSFFATAGSVARLGAIPVFVDIGEDCNINTSLIKSYITPKTKAILPVHLFGRCSDMDSIRSIATEANIRVIEDAAQAFGAEYKGQKAGTLSDIGCFSFFPSKNLGCYGDGGLVTTKNPELYEKMKMLRSHGTKKQYDHKIIGGNFRLDAIQAAILSKKLPFIDIFVNSNRIKNAEFYINNLKGCVTPSVPFDIKHIFNQFVIRTPDRDNLKVYLEECGIGTAIYYPKALPFQDCFINYGYREEEYIASKIISDTSLAIPVNEYLRDDELNYIVEKINNYFKK